jgi:hypothetical protein
MIKKIVFLSIILVGGALMFFGVVTERGNAIASNASLFGKGFLPDSDAAQQKIVDKKSPIAKEKPYTEDEVVKKLDDLESQVLDVLQTSQQVAPNREIQRLKADKLALEQAQEELISEIIENNREIKSLQQRLNAPVEKNNSVDNIAAKQNSILKFSLAEITKERDELRNRLELTEKERANLELQNKRIDFLEQSNAKLIETAAKWKHEAKLASEASKVSDGSLIELNKQIAQQKAREEELQRNLASLLEESTNKEKLLVNKVAREKALEEGINKLSITLDSTKNDLAQKESQLVDARSELSKLHALQESSTKLSNDYSRIESEKAKLELEFAKTKAAYTDLSSKEQRVSNELAELRSSSANKDLQISTLKSELSAKGSSLDSCSADLAEKSKLQDKVTELERTVVEIKNELLTTTAELEMLQPKRASSREALKPALAANAATIATQPTPTAVTQTMIVEVSANKASLRNGPGTEHGELMHVQRGVRLTVEARQGDWYRVVTPTGERAYISKDLVIQPARVASAVSAAPVRKVPLSKNEALVPFGKVSEGDANNLSDSEKKALEALKRGIGSVN